MITINDKKYDKVLKKVSFAEYSVTQDSNVRIGSAPIILFKFDNNLIRLETTYDKKYLEELNTNDKKDINKYISDITYEDENGWVSLITGNYNSFITKVRNNKFVFELKCEAEECGEYYNIFLKEEVEFTFE